jgi:ribosomal protein L40E
MAETVSGNDPAPQESRVGDDAICLRCDWTGATDSETCPRCEAPLYRLSESTKPFGVSPSPRPQPPSADDRVPSSPVEVPQEDDNGPPAAPVAVSRRKWLIVGAVAVGALWIVATGGPFDRHQAPIVSPKASGAASPSASGAASPSAAGRKTEPRVEVIGDVTSTPVRSPDGNRIVFGARGGTLYLIYVRSERRSLVVHLPGENLDSVDEIEWSPDGTHLAIMNDLEPGGGRLYVMNSDGSSVRVILDNYQPGGLAWSPDGESLAYATHGSDGADRLWTVSSVEGRPFTVAASDRISDPVWSPDGSRIAFVGSTTGGRGWYAVDADGAGPRREIDKLTYQSWAGPVSPSY